MQAQVMSVRAPAFSVSISYYCRQVFKQTQSDSHNVVKLTWPLEFTEVR